ncbi:ChaN family lipoprotein [Aestuariirhabdus sp. Z084]|uniref:ChaN family lipoprotein n=1 Tax=Aestuariirhabdus haliotis TaxID=2918751 RepID=UPI00201B3FE2|nr:ChaN family lipoprotein [Aestuariirhabdus haliotis]MCL6417337.1 ChaN family lipoprotein [Aestuariirhabdus haliotis]MCL6421282.1 ChaN family lipoprotein [Aestuariirhabdus haliotis]
MKLSKVVGVLGVVLVLSGCSAGSSIMVSNEHQLEQWQAPLNRQAPALGNIWSYKDQRWLSPSELISAVSQTEYLLLGEKHDNPDHHRIQWYLLNQLRQQNRLGSLTMEMLNAYQQPAVDRALELPSLTLEELEQHMAWDQVKGWPWDFYGPLMHLAIESGVPVRAGNLDRERVMAIYGQQPPYPERLTGQVQADTQAALEKQIVASHCGHAEGDHLQAMVRIQQSRDQAMATAMANQPRVSVLLAGAFHVRKDWGVPAYLWRNQPQAQLLSVAMVELSAAEDGSVAERVAEFRGVYDYLWFTAAMRRPDFCANWEQHSRGSE